jgi:hypothetical protein
MRNYKSRHLPRRCREAVLKCFFPILDLSSELTCNFRGRQFRSGVSRFNSRCKVGYLCRSCREGSLRSVILPGQSGGPLPVSLRVNAWPVFVICLTAISAAAVALTPGWLLWNALRTVLLEQLQG